MKNQYTSKVRRLGFRNVANIEMILRGKRRHYLIRHIDDFWVRLTPRDTIESKINELRRCYPELQVYKTTRGYLVTKNLLDISS